MSAETDHHKAQSVMEGLVYASNIQTEQLCHYQPQHVTCEQTTDMSNKQPLKQYLIS